MKNRIWINLALALPPLSGGTQTDKCIANRRAIVKIVITLPNGVQEYFDFYRTDQGCLTYRSYIQTYILRLTN